MDCALGKYINSRFRHPSYKPRTLEVLYTAIDNSGACILKLTNNQTSSQLAGSLVHVWLGVELLLDCDDGVLEIFPFRDDQWEKFCLTKVAGKITFTGQGRYHYREGFKHHQENINEIDLWDVKNWPLNLFPLGFYSASTEFDNSKDHIEVPKNWCWFAYRQDPECQMSTKAADVFFETLKSHSMDQAYDLLCQRSFWGPLFLHCHIYSLTTTKDQRLVTCRISTGNQIFYPANRLSTGTTVEVLDVHSMHDWNGKKWFPPIQPLRCPDLSYKII